MAKPPEEVKTAAERLEEAVKALAEMKLPENSPWGKRESELRLVKEQIIDVRQELVFLELELKPEPEPQSEQSTGQPKLAT
jgi:hypothetical protein